MKHVSMMPSALINLLTLMLLLEGCSDPGKSQLDLRKGHSQSQGTEDALALGTTKTASAQGAVGLVVANSGFAKIMSATQFTPNNQEIQITFSLQSSILTSTTVTSKNSQKSTSTAQAGIDIQFLVDGSPVVIGAQDYVTFNERLQQLTATLQGAISTCQASSTGFINVATDCTFTTEEIGLLVQTTSANAFTVTTPPLSSGNHTVAINARVNTGTSVTGTTNTGSAQAVGALQLGSLNTLNVRQ